MMQAQAKLQEPALRAALFEDAIGALHERRVAPVVELCRAAGPQLLKMQTAKKGNTLLHLAPSAVIAEVLLCLGADALATNADGQTPRECAAPDNAELVAVLRTAEQDALRRAPVVSSTAAVALAAADGDDVQVLELLRQTLRIAQAAEAAERCSQLWSVLQGEHLATAEQSFVSVGLSPPQTMPTAPAPIGDRCPPGQPAEVEAVRQVEALMTRTVNLIEGMIAEDRVARDQAVIQQQLLHSSLMQTAQRFVKPRACADDPSSSSAEASAADSRSNVSVCLPSSASISPVEQSAPGTAEECAPDATEESLDRLDADEYEDLHDAAPKSQLTGSDEAVAISEDSTNDLGENCRAGGSTRPTATTAVTKTAENFKHLSEAASASHSASTVAAAIRPTTFAIDSQLARAPAGSSASDESTEMSAANLERTELVEMQHAEIPAESADTTVPEHLPDQKDPHNSAIGLQHVTSKIPTPTLGSNDPQDPDETTGPPATEAHAPSYPRTADAEHFELPRHERKALIERHKRVKMVQTMFDKYARRDERSPAGAMGRKELSQLSKDSGSARIDSAYFRDTCEALRADPDVGILSEHLAQLYLDGGAWSATLVSDYKKIFGTKRVKAIAPPVAARPDELNAFVAGSQDDLDDV